MKREQNVSLKDLSSVLYSISQVVINITKLILKSPKKALSRLFKITVKTF